IVVGYVAGSIPTGYWLVRAVKREDIRTLGSGNIGGTNVWRVFGRRLGFPVVFVDTLKGFAPALAATLVVSHLAGVLAGGAALLGEPWPVIAFACVAAVAVVLLHRANIARLRAGTENRFRFPRAAA